MNDRPNVLNLAYVERLYAEYLDDPQRVPEEWRHYFAAYDERETHPARRGGAPSFPAASIFNPPGSGNGAAEQQQLWLARLQERVDQLIRNYRVRGHIIAKIDPLGRVPRRPTELRPEYFGFSPSDLDRAVSTVLLRGSNVQTLRAVIDRLEAVYCGAVGSQFMHIDDLAARDWLQSRIENPRGPRRLTRDQQLRILTRLTDAVLFEEFVRKKYVGMKSFSLEGAETLIPLLDLAIDKLGRQGVREICLSMSHRGRLNVLANILGKRPQQIFREFEDVDAEFSLNRGDVKYHLGYHNHITTGAGHEVHISLGFNPSHLEFVNPVTLGRCRGKQDRFGDSLRRVGAALLIHGDAAFAGEGIVQESLNLSQLPGYEVGGAVHVILNNQIGFTTSPEEGRSCGYASDVAKMLQIPIFHVNGEDPEAVAWVVELALDFRAAFRRDVVIDMYCFRRWGHNEGDEPAFTQPLMYAEIERRPTVRASYLAHLLAAGEVTQAEADQIAAHRLDALEQEWTAAQEEDFSHEPGTLESMWHGFLGRDECFVEDIETGDDLPRLVSFLERLTAVPDDFHVHRRLRRVLEHRQAMARQEKPLDWATAELLALASVAAAGYRVRFSGQDSQRGTFSQRHAVLHDTQDDHVYCPLQYVSPDQANVEILNSPLSEAGALGFEYGYSLVFPDGLVLWEAQFGDFGNAAQVIIDQFIASAEHKWQHLSGLVMLLPHGFEGQGPEHSSARLERFLGLSAEDNIQIVAPTTPAQYFHLLRRQVVRPWRKPLVVFTPKSLLRHPLAVSPLEACTRGRFQRVLPDPLPAAATVTRVLLCTGKIYFDLLEARQEHHRDEVAIVRLEQLYPFPDPQLRTVLDAYPEQVPVYWVQEEPENMGAAAFLRGRFCHHIGGHPVGGWISRPPSPSPATGSHRAHRLEQQEIINKALGLTRASDRLPTNV